MSSWSWKRFWHDFTIVIVTLIIGFFLEHWVIDYWRDYNYKGPDISGKWEGEFVFEGIEGNEKLFIEQSGCKISGTIHTITIRPDGEERILDSKIIGQIRDEYLVAYYVPIKPDKFGCGSFTFKLLEGGKRLEGTCPFQYSQTRELEILEYGWDKIE